MGKVVGIDLGTTNSVVAFKEAMVEVVDADDYIPPERKLTRSLVTIDYGRICVGRTAYNRLKEDPEMVISSVKRLMGRSFGDSTVQEQINRFRYKISVPSQGTDSSLSVWLKEELKSEERKSSEQPKYKYHEYQPEDISSEILKQVVHNVHLYLEKAGRAINEPITEAVITVPAYFNDQQRYATRNAALKAGLTPRELLAEPTAASISYGFSANEDIVQTLLVADFGGGTFDASLITASGNQFIEQSKAGDLWLGGDDIDELIINYVKEEVAREEEIDDIDEVIAQMPKLEQVRLLGDLKVAAENAKIELSDAESVGIIPATPILDEDNLPILIDVELTRTTFEGMIEGLVERTVKICQNALIDAEYSLNDIDKILLVGGSSQIPFVKQKYQQAFGSDKIVVHPRPMYAVAEGAAIVASGLTEKVLTVSRDYYIKLESGLHKIISRGDILPVITSHTFKTVANGQRLIHFEFFNRDHEQQKDERIGQMWLGLEESYPEGLEILVTAELDEQTSILRLTAALKNNPSIKASCTLSRGNSDEKIYCALEQEIEKLIKEDSLTAYGAESAMKLAVPVIKASNMIIDENNGAERPQFRQIAEKSLQYFHFEMSDDYINSQRCKNQCTLIIEICGFLITEEQLQNLQNLKNALEEGVNKKDTEGIKLLNDQIYQEIEQLPDLVQVLRYAILAAQRATSLSPTDGNAMFDKLLNITKNLEQENNNTAKKQLEELLPDVEHWLGQELPAGVIRKGVTT